MYICSTNRIYIYIKISIEHLKFGYNLDPKNDFKKKFFFVAVLHGMWDLISLIRDGTLIPCIGSTET